MELLSKLGIDWKLLIAQIVNFAILFFVLSAFVYRPLLALLDARRERVRKAIAEARRIEEEAERLAALRTEKLRKIDQECGAVLERAKHDAEQQKEEILLLTGREAEQILARGRKALEEERARAEAQLQGAAAALIVRLTAKLLEREFSEADQQRLLTRLESDLPRIQR